MRGAGRTVYGEVDEEEHAVLNGSVEGRAGAERAEALGEVMRQGHVQLPAQALQDFQLEAGKLVPAHLAVMNLFELGERRQLAVREFGGDEQARRGDHLDELLVRSRGGRAHKLREA